MNASRAWTIIDRYHCDLSCTDETIDDAIRNVIALYAGMPVDYAEMAELRAALEFVFPEETARADQGDAGKGRE